MIVFCPGTEILLRISKVRKLEPDIQQEGGWEIHPALQGLEFNFWFDPTDSPVCWVNQTPSTFTDKTPGWASYLTGFKATRGFAEAKRFLRERAAQLAQLHEA